MTHDNGAYVKRRCRWCQCFVAKDTEPTVRTVKGVRDGVTAWRTFSQILCPTCSGSWTRDWPWNRAPEPGEVAEVLT